MAITVGQLKQWLEALDDKDFIWVCEDKLFSINEKFETYLNIGVSNDD